MPEEKHERILVTAALPYANGPIHLGHLAGAYLPADLYSRYQRLKGRDVVFICGSDEMGVPIFIRAREEGIDPQELVDQYHDMIVAGFDGFGMSFDHYGRTTSETHRETTQDFFRQMAARDLLKLKTEKQLYDPEAEMFLADRFVRGTCPTCGYDDAYGDQCENCGTSLSPAELVEPRSALTDAAPEERETTHWYLPLGDFQARLEEWIDEHPEWKANVRGQVRSWFEDGLKDRAITRDLDWGVQVPLDVADEAGVDASGKVMYVWFDAPIGYISATKAWAAKQGDPVRWKTYWQRDDTKLVHFIGKDNIVFHCLMFPAMLMGHEEYVLPDNVPANEFLNIEHRKLSTSRGWAVWLHEYLEDFPPDLLRYVLATTLPETKDADFSWSDFQTRVNSELADILGNFVNRTLTFTHRYFNGRVPALKNPTDVDTAVLDELSTFPERIGASYETYRLREAVAETMNLARIGNRYFNDTEPWHTRESDKQACANTIHVSLQLCASLSLLMEPVLPHSAQRLRDMLNLTGLRSSMPGRDNREARGWDAAAEPLLTEGHTIGEAEILFEKIEDDQIGKQMARLKDQAELPEDEDTPYEEVKDEIQFDDFMKLDLRTGTVTAADPVPDADKLLRLDVDLGFESRQVLAGVAKQMEPDHLIGRRVVIVANLAPRTMFGLESQGMLLMAEDREGRLVPIGAEVENGAIVR